MHSTPQKSLALTLGLTPQGLSEIFAGRNRPNSETTLRMLEFLQTNMKSETIGLPNLRTVCDEPDERLDLVTGKPKTLGAAKELIDDLRAQLKTQSVAVPPTAKVPIVLKAATAPTPTPPPAQMPPIDPSAAPGFKRVQSPSPQPPPLLSPSLDTPFKIGEVLKNTSFEDCLALLANPKHTRLQLSLLYSEVKLRRDLEAGRQ